MNNANFPTPEELYDGLIEKIRESGKPYDTDKIKEAFDLANKAHLGQKRKSGEPYISHPIAVAEILVQPLGMDTETVIGALLHDVVEDTSATLDELRELFGEDVANLVDGVTKIANITKKGGGEDALVKQFTTKEEAKAETTRKILIAMFKDVRVIVIKIADRVHNMRTLDAFDNPAKQRRISLESMYFYAPLAHRLGIAQLKEELEDRSLYFLDKIAYKEIEKELEQHKEWREKFIEMVTSRIRERLGKSVSPPPIIEGRVKGIYSLHKKMYATGKNLSEVHDVYAIRIITENSPACYGILGEIHELYTPIHMSFKDYIANPKENGYQSLHTTVIGKEKQPFEVQIRTHDMHKIARYGIAAHWRYKLGETDTEKLKGTKFDFIHQILDQYQPEDLNSIANAIKNDLATNEIHVFTPTGDVVSLPEKSTVVDFAYKIHTRVGNKMTGAKVNSKMVNYNQFLYTGDIVEILTTSNNARGPDRSWLAYAKTDYAKSSIKKWLKRERKSENISSGRAYVNSVITREGIITDEKALTELAFKHRYKTLDGFYAAIGYGGILIADASLLIKDGLGLPEKTAYIARETPPEEISESMKEPEPLKEVCAEGGEESPAILADCCKPLPGDEIVGFPTDGNALVVHRKECQFIDEQRENGELKKEPMSMKWLSPVRDVYSAVIEIIAVDRRNLLFDITQEVFNEKIQIVSCTAKRLKNGNAEVILSVEISGLNELQR
ncbi:MAG: RelA/SpoT family protein, partial [Oscillospiraceae bacterium]|nr:RelA/SpoT family protein [Oscillospiraceae bacterium]